MTVIIREATADDIVPMSTVTAEGFRKSKFQESVFPESQRIKPGMQDRIDWLVERSAPKIGDPHIHFIVAEEDGEIVGTAQWISPPEVVEGEPPKEKPPKEKPPAKSDEQIEAETRERLSKGPSYLSIDAVIEATKEVQGLLASCEDKFHGKQRDDMWSRPLKQ